MRVQFESGNNTRAGTSNVATLPCKYAHALLADSARTSVIDMNRPNSAVLYSWAIVDDDFSKFRCTFRRY